MSVDKTGASGGDFSSFLRAQPDISSGEESTLENLSSLLGEDGSSSNRADSPLYSSAGGGWMDQLKGLVDLQPKLQTEDQEPPVDLTPFLALLSQTAGGEQKPDEVDTDLQKFLRGEE